MEMSHNLIAKNDKIDLSKFLVVHVTTEEGDCSILKVPYGDLDRDASACLACLQVSDLGIKTVKLVGRQEGIATSSRLIEKFQIPIEKRVPRSEGVLVFDASSGRVFVEKSVEVQQIGEKKLVSREGRQRVLVIDDSKTISRIIADCIGKTNEYEVVGTVSDSREAMGAIEELQPDLITVDINMPHIDGLQLIRKVKPKFVDIPMVVVTSLNVNDSNKVLDCIEAGAFDYIEKPALEQLTQFTGELKMKMDAALDATPTKAFATTSVVKASGFFTMDVLIAIGSSTGGTQALQKLFTAMPKEIPPTVVVQHIPAVFSKALAERLNTLVPFEVCEAEDGMEVIANRVIIAAGGHQMRLERSGSRMHVHINDDPPVNRFRPSVDYLFDSIEKSRIKLPVISVMLTGMGRDGSAAMASLKKNTGSVNIAQDEATSVVFGMPKAAIELGCIDHVEPIEKIASRLCSVSKSLQRKKAS